MHMMLHYTLMMFMVLLFNFLSCLKFWFVTPRLRSFITRLARSNAWHLISSQPIFAQFTFTWSLASYRWNLFLNVFAYSLASKEIIDRDRHCMPISIFTFLTKIGRVKMQNVETNWFRNMRLIRLLVPLS